jgi:HEAT repeat protein
VAELMTEVARFREWAKAIPPEQRHGEWECDYGCWGDLYDAVLAFVDATLFARWSPEEERAVLFAVARDNEMQHLAGEIRSRNPETLIALARAAIDKGERDARWQFAEELGQLGRGGEPERLLLLLVRDEDEYVRRRALKSLARLGSPAVEPLALAEWQRPDENQQWARMMVLWCLHRVRSPHLAPLLAEAETDERPYLSDFAKKVQRGEVEP